MLAKRTYKNQITIPQAVIKAFPNIQYFDVQQRGQEIVLKPVIIPSSSYEQLEHIRGKMTQLGIREKDIEEAVAWSRRKQK